MKYCDRDVFPWLWFIVLPSTSPKTACKSLRVTYVRTVTRFHVLETPPWSSEFGKCHKCHSWEPTVAQSRNFSEFCSAQGYVIVSTSYCQARLLHNVSLHDQCCYSDDKSIPPLLPTRQRCTAHRPSATATSTYPMFAATVKVCRLCCHVSCIPRSCLRVINLYLVGWKASFETPVNICWCHQGGNHSIIVPSIHRHLKKAVVCLADGRSVSVLMVNVWVESCRLTTRAVW
jgi:hypothetical protein